MLKPYVERRNNLVKEPANVNVLVSETRTFSNDSRSSHFSPTDTTKLKKTSVRCVTWTLSCHVWKRVNARTWRSYCKNMRFCFLMSPPQQIRHHGIDRRISFILLNKQRKLAFTNNTFRGTSFLSR